MMTPSGHQHGTAEAYALGHCHCAICRDTGASAYRRGREQGIYGRTHGLRSNYNRGGCRCEDCRRAEREYRRRYRARMAS